MMLAAVLSQETHPGGPELAASRRKDDCLVLSREWGNGLLGLL